MNILPVFVGSDTQREGGGRLGELLSRILTFARDWRCYQHRRNKLSCALNKVIGIF